MKRRTLLAAALLPGVVPQNLRAQEISHEPALPGRPLLIRDPAHPWHTRAPLTALTGPYTTPDLHFVHYRAGGPPPPPAADWALSIVGDAPFRIALPAFRTLPQVEIAAVCRCPDADEGAVACALWRGPRLRDVLAAASLHPGAAGLTFHGAGETPYQSWLPAALALHPDTLVAIDMNGAPLPHWNGAPARLVVPGHAGAAWTKHLASIEPATNPDQSPRALEATAIATSHLDGDRVRGTGFMLQGQAWDDGTGIDRVEVSITAGTVWGKAMMGFDRDRYGFRSWSLQTASSPGPFRPMFRAVSRSGIVQPARRLDLLAI